MIRLFHMINLPYHLSINLSEIITSSDTIRKEILTTPLSPKEEIKLRWEASLEKTYWGLTLADNPLSRKEMAKLISNMPPKKMADDEKEVLSYKNTLDYIRNNWTASKNLLSVNDVLNIYNISSKSVFGSTLSYYKSKVKEVSQILKYVESGNDHPIIKAGLIQIEIIKLSPFENATGRVARLLSHLILTKHGYDLRGLLILEDYYRNDLVALRDATKTIDIHKSATMWLEYFSLGVLNGMNKTLQIINNNKSQNIISQSYWKLNERLQTIVNTLENPSKKITNKDVQKEFNVSQITASRDLGKLTSMGILLAHGKGRSVFYTKV